MLLFLHIVTRQKSTNHNAQCLQSMEFLFLAYASTMYKGETGKKWTLGIKSHARNENPLRSVVSRSSLTLYLTRTPSIRKASQG